VSQSVPFDDADAGAVRVGERAPERRRRSDAALNRAKIIDAARRLLADDENPSMREIAATAGVGRGTVHRHFSTRDELMDAVRRQARDDAESDEEDYLRPPGELANVSTTPLSIADVLNKVPPFQLGDQIIAEAQRLPGVSSAALYVVDLDGASMQRLAGAATFPAQITAPLAVGPEIPREGVAAIRAVFEELLPGATVAPLQLRGRAISCAISPPKPPLRSPSGLSIPTTSTPSVAPGRPVPPPKFNRTCCPPASRASPARRWPATSCPGMRSAATGLTTPKTRAAPGLGSRTPPGAEPPLPASVPSPWERFAPPAAKHPIPPNACWRCTRCCSRSATAQPAQPPRSDTGTPRHPRFVG
jgi:AcrR family transcriptional regulator